MTTIIHHGPMGPRDTPRTWAPPPPYHPHDADAVTMAAFKGDLEKLTRLWQAEDTPALPVQVPLARGMSDAEKLHSRDARRRKDRDGVGPWCKLNAVKTAQLESPVSTLEPTKSDHLFLKSCFFQLQRVYRYDGGACAAAAGGGRLECLKFPLESGAEPTTETCAKAAGQGHLDVLKFGKKKHKFFFFGKILLPFPTLSSFF